jgi:hypothetical protein
MEKICPKCKISKSTTEFNKNKRYKDRLQRVCRQCTKKEHIKWYNNNKNTQIMKNKKVHENNKEWFKNIKQQYNCYKCKENRWYILDFHHVDPTEKLFNISNIGKTSKKKTLNEISKCITLCRNCHAEFHFLEKEEGIILKQYLGS